VSGSANANQTGLHSLTDQTPIPARSGAWQALAEHQRTLGTVHLRELFAADAGRFDRFSLQACGLLLDYSKHRITRQTMDLLLELAAQADLPGWIERLFGGELVNNTEHRAALHTALRGRPADEVMVDGANVMPQVHAELEKMRALCGAVHGGDWTGHTGRRIETVVNIGIGGSDLGPKMAAHALAEYAQPGMSAHFVSNLDPRQIHEVLERVDPETTLFVIVSKTFTTQETLANAVAARRWLVQRLGSEASVAKHFVAVSTAAERVREFGIDTQNMIGFWDWVGGRYSLWSAAGLATALLIGMDRFEELLAGARDMDEHFRRAPLQANMPVVSGMLGVWYANFWQARSRAVLPYDYRLGELPSYLQQLEMESNGKRVTRDGEDIDYATGPVVWGGLGSNGQHAFYQLFHQGRHLVPAEFLAGKASLPGHAEQHAMLLANCIAQTEALMLGRDEEQVRGQLRAGGLAGGELEAAVAHRVMPGNQPSSLLLYDDLAPRTLGALLAMYEHRVFVQAVCWGINPFDQWGVELGKQLAGAIGDELSGGRGDGGHDASTQAIVDLVRGYRQTEGG